MEKIFANRIFDKGLQSKNLKSSHKSIRGRQSSFKMGKRFEYTFYKRIYTDDR